MIRERMPEWLIDARFLGVEAWQWIGLIFAFVLACLVAAALGEAANRVGLRIARRTPVSWDEQLVQVSSAPLRVLLGIVTLAAAVQALDLAAPVQRVVDEVLRIGAVSAVCWAALRVLRLAADLADERLAREGGDEASARTRRTQLIIFRRIADVLVVLIGGAAVLLKFESLRGVGTSLLASAGVAGVVIGFAAQRTIATLMSGLQLSLTRPLRVGDVVVIDGEWGTIEQIALTYVVVRIWDLRRLVVPVTKILEAPFANLTWSGTELLGTVFVHADYDVPVDAVRRELVRFVRARPEWDGKIVELQVTNATDRALELRAVVSSATSASWDLRCAVREHLVGVLQRLDDGRHLPRTRVEGAGHRPPRNDAVGITRASSAEAARYPAVVNDSTT